MLSQGRPASHNPVQPVTRPWRPDNQTSPRDSNSQMYFAQVVRIGESGLEALESSNNVRETSWGVTN